MVGITSGKYQKTKTVIFNTAALRLVLLRVRTMVRLLYFVILGIDIPTKTEQRQVITRPLSDITRLFLFLRFYSSLINR